MSEFYRVNWHDPAFSKITAPVLVRVFVIDPILKVVRQQVLQLDRCTKFERDFGEFTGSPVRRDIEKSNLTHRAPACPP